MSCSARIEDTPIDAFDSTTPMSAFLTATTKRQISRCPSSTAKKSGVGRGLANCGLEASAGQPPGGQRRSVSDHGHFYRNRQLELYAAKEARRLTLRQLVRLYSNPFGSSRNPRMTNFQVWFGRSMTEDRLIKVRALLTSNLYFQRHIPTRARTMYEQSCQFGYRIVCGTCKLYRMSS